jgi:catechol 2,3-dioxygenase-like lactoylglutathione lyase family enzyme
MPNRPPYLLNAVTLGVGDLARSVRFYEELGLTRKFRAAGDEIAFFDAGGVVLALYPWDLLADDATVPNSPKPPAFRGMTLSRMCGSDQEVDAVLTHALSIGAKLLKPAANTFYGGYSGYFADPDGHAWEVVRAPGFTFLPDGRAVAPD